MKKILGMDFIEEDSIFGTVLVYDKDNLYIELKIRNDVEGFLYIPRYHKIHIEIYSSPSVETCLASLLSKFLEEKSKIDFAWSIVPEETKSVLNIKDILE